jgi:hypothetical protein
VEATGTYAIFDISNGLLVLDSTLMERSFQDVNVQDTSLHLVHEIFSSFRAWPPSMFKVVTIVSILQKSLLIHNF